MINWWLITLGVALLIQSAGASVARSSGEVSNKEQEVATLKKRAEAGDPKAQVQLGIAYASGNGVAPDESEAAKWFRKAAEKGDSDGEYSLGEMYLTGRGVSANLTDAAKWMHRAANHGDARGQFNLAAMYLQGQGVPRDEAEAARWMRKAADQGLAAGQFGLGSMYAHGKGVPQSETEAANWYRKAADQDDPAAMNNLAFLLATSADPKVHDPKEAIAVAKRAVEVEADNPACLDTLATAYFEAGQPDKAAETERRALTLKPDDPSYKKALKKYEAASQHIGTAGGRPLMRRDDFAFVFLRGGLPSAVFAKGGPPSYLFRGNSLFLPLPVSLNRLNPSNSFHPLDFRPSHSNDTH